MLIELVKAETTSEALVAVFVLGVLTLPAASADLALKVREVIS